MTSRRQLEIGSASALFISLRPGLAAEALSDEALCDQDRAAVAGQPWGDLAPLWFALCAARNDPLTSWLRVSVNRVHLGWTSSDRGAEHLAFVRADLDGEVRHAIEARDERGCYFAAVGESDDLDPPTLVADAIDAAARGTPADQQHAALLRISARPQESLPETARRIYS